MGKWIITNGRTGMKSGYATFDEAVKAIEEQVKRNPHLANDVHKFEYEETVETFAEVLNRVSGGNWTFKNKKIPALLQNKVGIVAFGEMEITIVGLDHKCWVRVNKKTFAVTM